MKVFIINLIFSIAIFNNGAVATTLDVNSISINATEVNSLLGKYTTKWAPSEIDVHSNGEPLVESKVMISIDKAKLISDFLNLQLTSAINFNIDQIQAQSRNIRQLNDCPEGRYLGFVTVNCFNEQNFLNLLSIPISSNRQDAYFLAGKVFFRKDQKVSVDFNKNILQIIVDGEVSLEFLMDTKEKAQAAAAYQNKLIKDLDLDKYVLALSIKQYSDLTKGVFVDMFSGIDRILLKDELQNF